MKWAAHTLALTWGRPTARGPLLIVILLGGAFAVAAVGLIAFVRYRGNGLGNQAGITLECAGCGRQLTVQNALAGKNVTCVKCGKVNQVP